ncbi:MAG: type IV secretion system protein [Burkholderiales bacterium]
MVKVNKPAKLTQEENVYLSHIEQDAWNEIQAYHIENKSAWRNVAILAVLALVLVAVGAMYMVNQDKHKVLVFEKDSLGNITTLGLATTTFKVDNKMIAHQLANFVIALREVPLDVALKRRNIDMLHKMIEPKLQTVIDQMLIEQYTKAKDEQILVNIKSIKPLEGGKSWEISWQESPANLLNSTEGITSWSTSVTFSRLDTVDPSVQLVNPIGLFITYIHPVQDIMTNKGI